MNNLHLASYLQMSGRSLDNERDIQPSSRETILLF